MLRQRRSPLTTRVVVLTKAVELAALVALVLLAKRFVYFDRSVPRGRQECANLGWTQRPAPLVVWDAVPLNSELDILDARLHELDPVVDHFVIVEAPYTFSGKRKPLHYNENKERFAAFHSKIVHVIVPDFEAPAGVTDVQELARLRKVVAKSAAMRGLAQANPGDLVISSDLDEIPRMEVIDALKRCEGYTTPVELQMMPFIYDFGCRDLSDWRRPKVVYRNQLAEECDGSLDGDACVDELRDNQHLKLGLFRFPTSIRDAGWHISYFMNTARIQEKIGSYAHVERDTPENRNADRIECLIFRCQHVNGKDYGHRSAPELGLQWTKEQALKGVPAYSEFYRRPLKKDACARLEAP